jgi:hypothetical protein
MSDTSILPAYITLSEYMRISGDGRTTTYTKIADGRLRAVKDGKRLKLDYPFAMEHLRGLPEARIRSLSRKTAV